MNKMIIGLGAALISLLLISTVTAVPQVHSEPTMDLIQKINTKKNSIEQMISNDLLSNMLPGGIIDLIIQIINFIIQVVTQLIQFVLDLINIVGLVQTLINAILTLIDMVQQFIQLILDLFNPDAIY